MALASVVCPVFRLTFHGGGCDNELAFALSHCRFEVVNHLLPYVDRFGAVLGFYVAVFGDCQCDRARPSNQIASR